MGYSAADGLPLVEPLLASLPVRPDPLGAVTEVCRSLPPIHRLGFEMTLGGHADDVSLQQFIRFDGREPEIVRRWLAASVSSGKASGNLALRSVLAEVFTGTGAVSDCPHLGGVWLDLGPARAPSERPSLFFELRPGARANAVETVNALLACLDTLDAARSAEVAVCRESLLKAVSHEGCTHLAFMLGRAGNALRAIYRLDEDRKSALAAELAPLLSSASASPAADQAEGERGRGSAQETEMRTQLGTQSDMEQKTGPDRASVIFDGFGEWRSAVEYDGTERPLRGVELFPRRTAAGMDTAITLFQGLASAALMTQREAAFLAGWERRLHPGEGEAAWPDALVFDALMWPDDWFALLECRFSHFKLGSQQDGSPGLKAYFGYVHTAYDLGAERGATPGRVSGCSPAPSASASPPRRRS